MRYCWLRSVGGWPKECVVGDEKTGNGLKSGKCGMVRFQSSIIVESVAT